MKRHKYGAVPQTIDGLRFASSKEARRYAELKLLERAGEISDLQLQPRYPLTLNGALICTYVADFAYHDKSGGRVTEDAKGYRTPVYRLKRKMFAAQYGYEITEV